MSHSVLFHHSHEHSLTERHRWTSTTNGSYSLEVVKHSGTFTITADYTAGDGNYKAGTPQAVKTTAATHSQNIALK